VFQSRLTARFGATRCHRCGTELLLISRAGVLTRRIEIETGRNHDYECPGPKPKWDFVTEDPTPPKAQIEPEPKREEPAPLPAFAH
jgi:hypothetical protein